MKKILMVLVGLVIATPLWAVAAQAATVHLNSGSEISGKIVETAADKIKVDIEGVSVTYYKDEIASIEGDEAAAKALGVASIAAAAPAEKAPEVVAKAAAEEAEPVPGGADAPAPAEAPAPAPVETIKPASADAVAPAPAAVAAASEAAQPTEPVAPSLVEPAAAAPAEVVVPAAVEPAAPAVAEPVVPVKEVAPAEPAAAPSADLSADKKGKILKFIEVFGTRETMKMNFEQILASMPPEEADKLKGAFNIDEVIQELVPLYDKHFTAEDLDGFIAFYSSPVGRKLVEKIPVIMKESIDVSARYFEEHMPADMKEGTPTPEN
jgi:hypothetical protein